MSIQAEYNQKCQQLVTILATLKEKLNTTDAELDINLNDSIWSFPDFPAQGSVTPNLQQSSHSFVESRQKYSLEMLTKTIAGLEMVNAKINADSTDNQKKVAKMAARLCLSAHMSMSHSAAPNTALSVVARNKPQQLPIQTPIVERTQPTIFKVVTPQNNENNLKDFFKKLLSDLDNYEHSFQKKSNTVNIDADKLACIHSLKNILQVEGNDQEKAQRFCGEVERLKSGSALQKHRTPTWQRFIVDLISCLTVLPMLYRAVKCYAQFEQLNFFKPKSQNLITHLSEQVSAKMQKAF